MTSLLDVQNVHAGYGTVQILRGVSLSIQAGELVALLGSNGAGKTTLNAVLSGLLPVSQGQVHFDGQQITGWHYRQIVRTGLIQVPEGRKIFPAGSLSGGEQQMLAIARALMSRPRLLLCDEPSLGLAPLITQELFAVLGRLNTDDGLAVLLVEQNANLAMHLASRVYLLETGRIVASGSAAEIGADDSIRKAYLGF